MNLQIVIIGMECCRYHSSPTLNQFWHTIREAQVRFLHIPYDHWNHALCPNAARRANARTDMRFTRQGTPVGGTHPSAVQNRQAARCTAIKACNSHYSAHRDAESVPMTLRGGDCYATGKQQ
jgi:hypothetical protein